MLTDRVDDASASMCKNAQALAYVPSSETQGQLVGAGKSLSGRETFLLPNFFFARLDFFPPPITAPGSPRMPLFMFRCKGIDRNIYEISLFYGFRLVKLIYKLP